MPFERNEISAVFEIRSKVSSGIVLFLLRLTSIVLDICAQKN